MPGVDSSPSTSSAYPHASDQTIVGFILIALVIFAAMAMIFRSLFKLARAARRLDRGVNVGEAVSEQSTTAVNSQLDTVKHRFKAAIPPSLKRWDDIDDKLDEFERLTVKYFVKAKLFAVHTMQNLGIVEKIEDEAHLEGGVASSSRSKDAWRLTTAYFNKAIGSATQGAAQESSSQQEPDDPADRTMDSEFESRLDDKSKLECSELACPTPTLQYRDDKECRLKEVRRITAIDILEALAKVGRMSLSYRSADMTTHRPDSLLPRVIRDSSDNVGDLKARELRRLTAIDYLSKVVASFPVDIMNKPLPHRPISIVASIAASERTQHTPSSSADDVTRLSQPASLSPPLSAISEESEESAPARPVSLSASVSAPILSALTEANSPNQHMDDLPSSDDDQKNTLPNLPITRPSSHRRSMTLPLQPLALPLSPSPVSPPVKNEEEDPKPALDLQLELRPTSNTPHITALAELADSIVGEHPDAPPILQRVASLTLTLSENPIPQVRYAWVGNSHRTTFGLVTRTNVPPTPPRLAMFEDGGDAAFRSNAGTVRVAGAGSVMGVGNGNVLGSGAGAVLNKGSLGAGVMAANAMVSEKKEAGREVQVQAGSGSESEGREGQVTETGAGDAIGTTTTTPVQNGNMSTPVQILSMSTPVQNGSTPTPAQIGSTPTPVQIRSITAPVQIASRTPAPLPMQARRIPAPMRNTRGKENRYLGAEAPRTLPRSPSHLRNVLCAI